VWDRDHRRGPGPRISAYRITTPADALPAGRVVTKRHVRVIISWPSHDAAGQGVLHHPTEKE
jgi:protein-L-isoaspartate(D-aspartate) O-methyltransferase